jgi:hypothetical protein
MTVARRSCPKPPTAPTIARTAYPARVRYGRLAHAPRNPRAPPPAAHACRVSPSGVPAQECFMKTAMHDRSAPERIAVGLRLSPTRHGIGPKVASIRSSSRARGVSAEDQLRPVIRGHCCGRQNWIERRASTIDSLAFTCLNGQKRQALAPGFAIALTGCALAWGWEEHRCTRKSVSRGVCPATGTCSSSATPAEK